MANEFKSGFVTFIGRPNVGKSTLMNRLIGQKIAITSSKPQTTRNRIQTVYTDERGQIIFLDTPGINKAKNKLGNYMLQVAERTLNEVDVVLWLVEPSTFIGGGEKYIIEEINDLKFMVHPNSFLQVNHDQAEAMYNKALSYIEPSKNNVIDAYCGIGSITLNLAKRASHVYGIEVVRQAIDNANENKRLNNINNASFICGKCEDEITKLSRLENIDTIVVDPPRKGCDTKFLDVIVKMKIKKIIYISCLTQSLARDAKYLSAYGYKVKEVTPFDLFSHSYHVECVTLLELKKQIKK